MNRFRPQNNFKQILVSSPRFTVLSLFLISHYKELVIGPCLAWRARGSHQPAQEDAILFLKENKF